MANLVTTFKDTERRALEARAKRDLFWLATEVLGYNLLTESFHKPMMDAMDSQRARFKATGRGYNSLDLWPRDHYKTTVQIARNVQDYIIDPATTVIWWHAVEEKAVESGLEVGRQLQECQLLRRIVPDIIPPPTSRAKKWRSASGFRLDACKDKAPSMRMYGTGSEATGGHAMIVYPDDIIGLGTIEDGSMNKVRRWWGQTVRNVVRTQVGIVRATGTHWDIDDIWADFRKGKRGKWEVRVRSCYETDGKADWNGEPVLYDRKAIEAKRSEMSAYEFSCQMMNEPLHDSQRMWREDICEHFLTREQAMKHPGRIFVISDPAPAEVGSQSGAKEKERGDGSKDWWSLAVVRIRAHKMRQEIILLDGRHSQGWTRTEGLRTAAQMMLKWGTPIFLNETYGGLAADYSEDMKKICREIGVQLWLDKDGQIPKFKDSYAKGAKNLRVEALSDKARQGSFLICDSVPDTYLWGDGEYIGFLPQVRKFRALASGRNNLKWDDDVDVVARSTDHKLQEFSPQPERPPDPFVTDEEDNYVRRSRYCGI